MLVLSRKTAEQIRIGDDITITVCGLRGNRVKLGFDAPQDVSIVRAELQSQGIRDAHRRPDAANPGMEAAS